MKNSLKSLLAIILLPSLLFGQKSEVNIENNYSVTKGDIIWVGDSNINSFKRYVYNFTEDEYSVSRNTNVSFNFKRISMISDNSGIGVIGKTQFLVSNRTNFYLAYLGGGLLYRQYFLSTSSLDMYFEGNSIIGHRLALGDATESGKSDDLRLRPGLKYGLNYNLNKKTGLFFEIGPEWESDFMSLDFDSKAIRATIGIQFLKNNK